MLVTLIGTTVVVIVGLGLEVLTSRSQRPRLTLPGERRRWGTLATIVGVAVLCEFAILVALAPLGSLFRGCG